VKKVPASFLHDRDNGRDHLGLLQELLAGILTVNQLDGIGQSD
jgi:hypothetical protein